MCEGAAARGGACPQPHPRFPLPEDVVKAPVSVSSINTAQVKAGSELGGVGGQRPHCRPWQLLGTRAADLMELSRGGGPSRRRALAKL